MRRREKLDQIGPMIDRAETLDRDRRTTIQAVEERKAARNTTTQEVARRKKAKENADHLVAQSRAIGEEIGRLEAELAASESELERIMLEIPNIPLPEVPNGGEECNVIVREWGTPRMEAGLKPHWEISETLGIIDLARGAKISGSGFVVYRKGGARLVRSLMNFFLDVHAGEHGYEEAWVPVVVNRPTMTGTGQLRSSRTTCTWSGTRISSSSPPPKCP
jgi:seryl-tRNA synthetase